MRWTVALLAAVLVLAGVTGCGEDGAEPGAPKGASLVLDFTPNAVHSGIFIALAKDFYKDAGVDLTVRAPGESTDAPKLLAAGRAEFAILDIHDLGIARERGLDLVALMPIVNAPLASVIARADGPVKRPRDLEGRTVGVTGLPSDEAVVDSEVRADGGDPEKVERVTIGFNAVAALAAGKVDAVTGFWNSEAVALEAQDVPVRVFKLDDYGAPRYPELVLATSKRTYEEKSRMAEAVMSMTERGYLEAMMRPGLALDALVDANPELDATEQARQLRAISSVLKPTNQFDARILREWMDWDLAHGLLSQPIDLDEAFLGTYENVPSDEMRQRFERLRQEAINQSR